MRKIIIIGNSGSGKSTLARHIADQDSLAHLDLDTVAWLAEYPKSRAALQESLEKINEFCRHNRQWVIEGCYGDILTVIAEWANEMIFLNLSIESCIENARSRPWEPHKYSSQLEQNKNLPMLEDWISKYKSRQDEFSYSAHEKLFVNFEGEKRLITDNVKLSSGS